MKVLIVSDTHGQDENLEETVLREAPFDYHNPGTQKMMSMCNQYLMSLQSNLFLIGKVCKKVIISCDNRTWTSLFCVPGL